MKIEYSGAISMRNIFKASVGLSMIPTLTSGIKTGGENNTGDAVGVDDGLTWGATAAIGLFIKKYNMGSVIISLGKSGK